MFKKCKRIARKYWNKILGREIPPVESPDILASTITELGLPHAVSFAYNSEKEKVLSFVTSMRAEAPFEYYYSASTKQPNIYNSVYACMLYGLFNEASKLTAEEKQAWVDYFNKFQNPEDGLYYDDRIDGELFRTCNWWGAEHLCPHIINAYGVLGARPQYEFTWVKKYYDLNVLKALLDECDWNSAIPNENDIDNRIMNVGVMLQYQRDFWKDKQAGKAVEYLENYLRKRLNPETSMWGAYDVNDTDQLARMIQFSYHLYRIFIYDKEKLQNPERMIDLIIRSQNKYGGFGYALNSSACEDIDAIDLLIYASKQTEYRKVDVYRTLTLALVFIFANQNEDGGSVFRRDEAFGYGHYLLSSKKNQSGMFPTWFRALCVAYIVQFMGDTNYKFEHIPGY
jgi:hypothetical protein